MDNGLTVVVDPVPSPGTTAIAFYLPVGSRHETPEEWGYAHFLEHAVFKGAGEWDGQAVAAEMDRLGGEVNAFTTRDYTAFYAKVLSAKATAAGQLLLTLITRPHLREEDLARERDVIRQEWYEGQDDLEDLSEQRYMEALWHDTPLAHDVLGTPETIAGVESDGLRRFWQRHYRPGGAVLVVAGSGAQAAAEALTAPAAAWPAGEAPDPLPALQPGPPGHCVSRVRAKQVHVVIGRPAPVWAPPAEAGSRRPAGEGDRFSEDFAAALLFVTVFGGQNSSRLWTRLREREGLVYSTGAGLESHPWWADMNLFLAVEPRHLARALRLAGEELARLIDNGPHPDELERARTLLHTNWVFGLETPDGRAHRAGPWLLAGRLPPSAEELDARLAAVDPERLRQAAARWWQDPTALAVGAAGAIPKSVPDLRIPLAKGLGRHIRPTAPA